MQITLQIGEVQEGGLKGMALMEGETPTVDPQEQRVIDAMKYLFQIPTILNPEFISKEETPEVPERINEFSDADWVQEAIKRWIISQVARVEKRKALDAIQIQPDNTLIS